MNKSDRKHRKDDELLAAHVDSMTDPTEAALRDDAAMVEWARTAKPNPDSPTIVRGQDAADLGRALIAGAKRGRPGLDPGRKAGEESPTIRFRVDAGLNRKLDDFVAQQQRHGHKVNRSDVGREALVAFLDSQKVS